MGLLYGINANQGRTCITLKKSRAVLHCLKEQDYTKNLAVLIKVEKRKE
jgi:hypothetical protein